MIKYKYAKDENGRLVEIGSLTKTDNPKSMFFCIGCENELIPKLGQVKVHHFAHKKAITCSAETYLHKLGKQLFYDIFTECIATNTAFYIEVYQKKTCSHYKQELGQICSFEEIVRYDLTQYFDKITIETREDEFIPDVMLISKSRKDKVFVEIAVTHFSSEKKISSNYRIIEIGIENEDDLRSIREKLLSVNNYNVNFKNFEIKELTGFLCEGNCEEKFTLFTLDNEGRGTLQQQKNLKQISQQINIDKHKLARYLISPDTGDYPEVYRESIARCIKENLNIRNCFVCRYHARNEGRMNENRKRIPSIFCKYLRKECNSNEAVTCEYFRMEKEYVDGLEFTSYDDTEE